MGTQCIITTTATILIQNQIAIRFNHDLNRIGDLIETLKYSIQRASGIHMIRFKILDKTIINNDWFCTIAWALLFQKISKEK